MSIPSYPCSCSSHAGAVTCGLLLVSCLQWEHGYYRATDSHSAANTKVKVDNSHNSHARYLGTTRCDSVVFYSEFPATLSPPTVVSFDFIRTCLCFNCRPSERVQAGRCSGRRATSPAANCWEKCAEKCAEKAAIWQQQRCSRYGWEQHLTLAPLPLQTDRVCSSVAFRGVNEISS